MVGNSHILNFPGSSLPRDFHHGVCDHPLSQSVASEGIVTKHRLSGRSRRAPALVGFYLLHGLSDDHSIWTRRTSIERYVSGLPLVVVMPDGGRGWYTNAALGLAYEDDLIKDVMGLVDRTFPVKADRSGRAIGGLSMGGYGAVKLGFKHPEMFTSVNSHSGAVGAQRDTKLINDLNPEFERIFGKSPEAGPEDPWTLAERGDHGRFPALRLDCGTDDFLLEQNRAFHRHLESLHVPHEYQEFPGGHDWTYWDRHVQEAIAFHVRCLKLQARK